jgi:uncharacterized membrane protein HdeD (DUF308 family)
MPGTDLSKARLHLDRANWLLLGGAVLTLVLGYVLLAGGSTSLAPILLVLGYCVLFPLGLAL